VIAILVLTGCNDARVLSAPCDGDCSARIHPAGILDPASPEFHGADLARRNWDFPLCATCHGTDFRGGTSGVSCASCHAEGPTACTTCHAGGPTTAAHAIHASTGVACGECHVVPSRWDTDGHILHDGIAITGPAKVTFGAKAARSIDPADRAGAPSWDGTTCTNVYCHGDALHAAGGHATEPRWTDATAPGRCDGCHGDPPPNHVRTDCATCHPASAPHLDGIVQVGTAAGCSGCHGGPSSPAPPRDLLGNTFTTAIGVGAHQAHLQAPSRLSAPIACATCHVVPSAIDSPGHIAAGPAKVNAELGWDRDAQTCAGASCHGPARPTWTSSTQVACGSCHGIPPADANHTPAMSLASCASCHPQTIDASGTIIVTGGTSKHINGTVDL
jgi:predicted CxxxxCH...CXXCH cytochrome family protein